MKPGYKKTEIGVIPEDWDVSALGNLLTIHSGESPSKFKIYAQGVPFFKVEQLNNSTKYQTDTPYFVVVKNPVMKGSIVFPKRGAAIFLNKLRILAQDSYFDTNIMSLTVNPVINNELLFYILTYLDISKLADTTSIPQINNKHIVPRLVGYPDSINEQLAIVRVLSDFDSLITSLEMLINKKKNIRQGVMQELLTGKKRLPGFAGEWETTIIDTCCHILKGRGLSKSQLTSDGLHDCILYGELFTTYNDVIEKVYNSTNSNEGVDSIAGDILLPGSTTTTGIDLAKASALLQDGVRLGGDINILRPKRKLDSSFFAIYLNVVKRYVIAEKTKGITIHHLHGNDIKNVIVELPSLSEQKAISAIIVTMDIELHSLENQLNKHRLIKEGMMQELLTGRIRLI